MITEKLQNAINEQITAEMWSSNLYLAMSFYMEKEGYCGMASWLKKQSFEEHAHACELASYIIKRGGKAKLDKVDVVPNDFGTPLEVFEQVYEHECRVSKMIDALVDVAAAEKDKASQDFLWGFGPSGEGYFRLTAFGTYENTVEAIERMKKIIK